LALLGAPYDEAPDRWGWSNLFKIGSRSENDPGKWPQRLRDDQRDICATSLSEEFAKLHNSLIVIASNRRFDVLDNLRCFPKLISSWNNTYDKNFK